MNFHLPYLYNCYGPMLLVAPQDLPSIHRPPTIANDMKNITGSQDKVVEHHYYYGCTPAFLGSPWYWQYSHLYTPLPNLPLIRTPRAASPGPRDGEWPEGFNMKGELRWGKLQRVFGVSRELPDFVKKDLRRVYGTYPSTGVSISFHRGEFVVRGDPRIGEQEYRLEKKVVRKVESPHNRGGLSENVRKDKKNRKNGK